MSGIYPWRSREFDTAVPLFPGGFAPRQQGDEFPESAEWGSGGRGFKSRRPDLG